MFSNEFEFDHTITTILDDEGELEDVQIILGDDSAFIRQFNEATNTYEIIILTPKMYLELIHSFNQTAGMFTVETERNLK